MFELLLKGIMIGVLFGVPAGAVGVMTMQRTMSYGAKAGLLTGLGSSVADCFYTCMVAFSLTFLSDILLKYQKEITIIGSAFIAYMGMSLLRKKEKQKVQEEALSFTKMFLSSFVVGITNPAVILTFLFAFSWMEIGVYAGGIQGIGLVCGVFTGTYLWWGALTGLTCFLKRKVRNLEIYKINQIFGCILVILGVAIFIRTI